MFQNLCYEIPPHLAFVCIGQTKNLKLKSKNNKIFNFSSNDDENAKPKAKNQNFQRS